MPGVTSCAGTAVNTVAVNTVALNFMRFGPQGPGAAFVLFVACCKKPETRAGESALTLLVSQVLADHHDPTVTADHLALVADLLDAGMNLHLPAVLIGLPVSDPRMRTEHVGVCWIGSGPLLVKPCENRVQR